jgi:hypothetical protein
MRIFADDGEAAAFEKVLAGAIAQMPARLLTYGLMPSFAGCMAR